jgi:hypothetical protein
LFEGIIESFSDAPGGFSEEMREFSFSWVLSIGTISNLLSAPVIITNILPKAIVSFSRQV